MAGKRKKQNKAVTLSGLDATIKSNLAAAAKASKASYVAATDTEDSDLWDVRKPPTEMVNDFLELFPDLKTAARIMSAVIMSPKDFASVELTFKTSYTRAPASVIASFLERVKTEIEDRYDIKRIMRIALRERFIGSGCLIKAVIPEGVIDKLIFHRELNTESIVNSVDLDDLGRHLGIITEVASDNEQLITVTDNVEYLHLKKVSEAKATREVTVYKHLLVDKAEDQDDTIIHLSKSYRERSDLNRPVLIDLPKESVKVIHAPNDPTKHLFYLVYLDENGYPIRAERKTKEQLDKEKETYVNSGLIRNSIGSAASHSLLENSKRRNAPMETFRKYVGAYIKERLSASGFLNTDGIDEDIISEVALTRALENKKTRILVLPDNMVTYFAGEYDNEGNGKSKLQDLFVLASLRGILLFSALGNTVSNQSRHNRVSVELDENISNVDKVMKKIRRAYMNMNEDALPVGASNAREFTRWQQMTGTTFVFRGHPNLPNISIEVEKQQGDRHEATDTQLLEDVRKQLILAIGPTPEMVDQGFDANHAVTSEENRKLLGKNAEDDKETLLLKASQLTKNIVMAHPELFKALVTDLEESDSMKEVHKEDKKLLSEEINKDFKVYVQTVAMQIIDGLTVNLPEISATAKMADQSQELSELDNWLSNALPAYMSRDIITEAGMDPDDANEVDRLFETYKSYFKRQYLASVKTPVNLNEILVTDGINDPGVMLAESMYDHNVSVAKAIKLFLERERERKKELEPNDNTPAPQDYQQSQTPPEDQETPPQEPQDGEEGDTSPAGGEDQGDGGEDYGDEGGF